MTTSKRLGEDLEERHVHEGAGRQALQDAGRQQVRLSATATGSDAHADGDADRGDKAEEDHVDQGTLEVAGRELGQFQTHAEGHQSFVDGNGRHQL